MSQLRVNLFRNGRAEFIALLKEHGVQFQERWPQPGVIMNSGLVIEIINSVKELGSVDIC